MVKENGDLINYPKLNDLKGEGVIVGNGFFEATYTDYFVGNWTNNGSADLIIRNSSDELRALKFSGTTFYGQTINGKKFPVVSHGVGTAYTDFLVGNWTGNGTSDLIIRNSSDELRALKFSGTTFYEQTIDGKKFPVVAHGVGASYTDFLVGDWTNDGISDLLMVNQNGKITINKFNGITFYGQTIGGQTNPVEVFSNTLFEDYYVGDFTGDQYPDLLVVNDTNDLFLLRYNPNLVKFENPELITTNFKYSKILVGNWNN